MRSYRTPSRRFKKEVPVFKDSVEVNIDNMKFEKYKFYEPLVYELNSTHTIKYFPNYSESLDYESTSSGFNTGSNVKGLVSVEEFAEEIRFKRKEMAQELSEYAIPTDKDQATIDLIFFLIYEKNIDDIERKSKTINVHFIFTKLKGSTEVTEHIRITQGTTGTTGTSGPDLSCDNLTLDSDVTDYLYRFTRGSDWGCETVGILDFNPNQCVNKGVYFTLNAPFNTNIGWIGDVRKPIYGYFIVDQSIVDS